MLEETSQQNGIDEAASEEESAKDAPSPEAAGPGRDRGRLVAFGVIGTLVVSGVGLIIASPKASGAPAPPPLALTNAELASQDAGKEQATLAADAGATGA